MPECIIYVLKDGGSDQYCKIGKDTRWPCRFHQAQSHSPRGSDVVALWRCDRATLQAQERLAHQGLPRRRETEGEEWFAIPPHEAVENLVRKFGRNPDVTANPPQRRIGPYDDWRSLKDHPDKIPNKVYKRRLWTMIELSDESRIKTIHSIHYDVFFTYCPTYNPHRVRIAACYEWPVWYGGPTPRYRDSNVKVVETWERITSDLGHGPMARCCGWLRPGMTLSDIDIAASRAGLVPFDFRAPKSAECFPKDSSITQLLMGIKPPAHRLL